MDPNWIIAIIAISAILSPAIVSIIDNIFKYKTKQLELYFPNKQKALSCFVEKALAFYVGNYFVDKAEYDIAKNNLYTYFEINSNALFSQLENSKKEQNLVEFENTIQMIVNRLSSQLNK